MSRVDTIRSRLLATQHGVFFMPSNAELVAALPKAELHVHLEGTLEPELLFDLAIRNGIELPFDDIDAVRRAYQFDSLQDFLDIYYAGMQVLENADDFYDLALAYFRRAKEDNVRHIEAFFDPQAHTGRDVALEDIFTGFERAIREARLFGVNVLLIPCFLRHLPAADAEATLTQLLPYRDRIVGVGLDSGEVGNPPSRFVKAFVDARANGLQLVAHAGEEGPPAYVWEAIGQLKVDRIDHGNRAMEDKELIAVLVESQTTLTVCPLSNLRLCVVDDLVNHPLLDMLDAGLAVTVNSDDPAYFGGYINRNFTEISAALDLSAEHIVTLVRNSFRGAFLPDTEKTRFDNEVLQAARPYVVS